MKLEFVKLKHPIEINLKDFILDETFDCLKLGVSKSWLQGNFVEPDDFMGESVETATIWRYGNIDLHFYGEILYMIFSDYIDTLDGGPKIKLDKWILEDRSETKLEDWVVELNRHNKSFSVQQMPNIHQTHLILNEAQKGITLSFAGEICDEAKDPTHYTLGAIHLMDSGLLK